MLVTIQKEGFVGLFKGCYYKLPKFFLEIPAGSGPTVAGALPYEGIKFGSDLQ